MPSYPDDVNPGQFIPTTQIYDLGESNVNSEDFTIRLRHNLNAIALSLNVRDSGYYALEEFVNGQVYFPDYSKVDSASSAPATFRQVYRKVIDTGTLPNTAMVPSTIAHGITTLPTAGNTTFRFTRIYGCATNPAGRVFIPLPFASPTLVNNIQVYADTTNVYITTGSNRSAFTSSQIVLEYIKF